MPRSRSPASPSGGSDRRVLCYDFRRPRDCDELGRVKDRYIGALTFDNEDKVSFDHT